MANIDSTDTETAAAGRPVTWYVDEQVQRGIWQEVVIPPALTGLSRPLAVFRAPRKTNLIMYDWHGDRTTFCPPMWWDLAIGSGACGLGCRACVDQDTWIYTDSGPVTAKELHAHFEERAWKVLGYDSDFRAVWTPLVAVVSKPSPNNYLRIKMDTGHQVQVTPDHPMIVARAGHFDGWDGSFPAQKIRVGDWLPIVQKAPTLQKSSTSLDLLTMEWGIPVKVEDDSLAERLPATVTEIAKQIGQLPQPDRRYLLTRHASFGLYDLHEYKDVLQITQLEPDEYVRLRSAYGHHCGLPRYQVLHRNFGFVLGHYLAEGSRDARAIHLAVHQREVAFAKEQWEAFCDVPIVVEPHGVNGAALRIAHTLIQRLFELVVPGNAFTKRFPVWTWQAPQEFVEGLLEGLFFGDGHLDHFGSLIYATCSEGMAADVRLLLWQLGYSPTIVRNTYRAGKVAFQIRVQQQDATRLIQQLRLPWKVEERGRSMITQRYPYALLMRRRIIKGSSSSARWGQRVEAGDIPLCEWGRKIVEGNLGLSRVKKTQETPSTGAMVYDLQTGTENFVAGDGILVHNCFLMLTHRIRRDPMRHLLYDNLEDFIHASERWLCEPGRRRQHTLGVGIDRSDSLLYEGVTGHVRSLALLFANPAQNTHNNKLILLTKSDNTRFLADIAPAHRGNVVVTFSLNPESIADLWEGKWPDGERITPSIARRLAAARFAQELGFEVRVRIDPILTPEGWEEQYAAFIAQVRSLGITFRYWTLGTYREKNVQLDAWRQRWELLPMEWQPQEGELEQDGTHRHLPEARRVAIYTTVRDLIHRQFPEARVSLCKETHSVRQAVSLCNADCNCLI